MLKLKVIFVNNKVQMRFFYKYNQIKNLAYFVNIQKPLGKPILAMFYTRCCAFVNFAISTGALYS